jgi:hypothetical protein
MRQLHSDVIIVKELAKGRVGGSVSLDYEGREGDTPTTMVALLYDAGRFDEEAGGISGEISHKEFISST